LAGRGYIDEAMLRNKQVETHWKKRDKIPL
jgi:hypothetical protein